MNLHSLPKTKTKSKKRIGRGYGSGKGGHTVTRGTKGQLSRNKVHIWFEGGQLPLVKRLPFQRGKGRFKSLKNKPLCLNLKYLNSFTKNSKVTLESLVKKGLISASQAKAYGVKILGSGPIEKPLQVFIPISKSAAKLIKKAGGTVNK